MYLHIGGDVVVPLREVVGVFRAEGRHGAAKSFVVMTDDTTYLSSISVNTLCRRWLKGEIPFAEVNSSAH